MIKFIFFFSMAITLFTLPQLLVRYFSGKFVFDRKVCFLVVAFMLPIVWPFLDEAILKTRFVNFLQHSIGGGVAVGFVCLYLLEHIKQFFRNNNITLTFPKNFIFQFFFILSLVSLFGIANEILEFYLDLLNVGIFSADRYDTWYDLVANSTGGIMVFLIYRLCLLCKRLKV